MDRRGFIQRVSGAVSAWLMGQGLQRPKVIDVGDGSGWVKISGNLWRYTMSWDTKIWE